MSLFRQQLLWITGLFAITMLIFIGLSGKNTHKLLLEQHQNQLNHTSNQLSWMLESQYRIKAPTLFENELAEYLDPDHYTHVRLDDLTQHTHQEITRNSQISLVPQWFLDLELLPTLKEQRVLHHNWKKVANFTLERQPYLEYQALWRVFYQSVFGVGVAILLFALAIGAVLKQQLHALEKLSTRCTQALKQKIYSNLPTTSLSELQSVIRLINELSQQVYYHNKTQQKETARLESETYRDTDTGFRNQDFFKRQVNHWLNDSHTGGLILIRTELIHQTIEGLTYNEKKLIIDDFCYVITQATEKENALLGRVRPNEVAILLQDISEEKLRTLADLLKAMLSNLHQQYEHLQHTDYGLVLLHNESPTDYNTLFSRLDDALSNIKRTTSDRMIFLIDEENSDRVLQRNEWKRLLENSLKEKTFNHNTQPVLKTNGQLHHIELFTIVELEGKNYPPSKFLGKLEELNLSQKFDQYVVDYAIKHIRSKKLMTPVAVNLTDNSIKDAYFINWLNQTLNDNQDLQYCLYFEISESAYRLMPEATHLFCYNIQRQGFKFGIDNFGRNNNIDWDYIQTIRPSYVKIDRIYTEELNDSAQSQTLSNICRAAHNLNILPIATCVETETQKDRLSELFVDACQGYIHKQPEPV